MIPDFTNPETSRTWFGKRQYLLDMGVDGFKTDGGEFVLHRCSFLFMTAVRARKAATTIRSNARRHIPGFWAIIMFFSAVQATWDSTQHRAIGAGISSPQMMNCGMSFPQGLSAALSGILFWGFDLAGFAGPASDVGSLSPCNDAGVFYANYAMAF